MEAENKKSQDLFTTYEVKLSGYVTNEQGKTADVILSEIVSRLAPELLEPLEYCNAATDYDKPNDAKGRPVFLRYVPGSRVIVYTVKGSNEGWFCHVDMIDKNQNIKTLLLFKSLEWKPENIKKLESEVWKIVEGAQ